MSEGARALMADGGLIVAAFGGLFIGLLFWWGRASSAALTRAWAAAAKSRGLTQVGDRDLAGELDGFTVRANIGRNDDPASVRGHTRVVISGGLPSGLSLRFDHLLAKLTTTDISLGESAFDRVTRVEGDRVLAKALLNPDTRALVKDAVNDLWSYSDGAWTYARYASEKDIGRILDRGVALARALRDSFRVVPARLFDKVASDPAELGREEALAYLLRSFPDHSETRRALQVARHDGHPGLRLIASRHLEDLVGVAAVAADPSAPDATCADAIAALMAWRDHTLAAEAVGALLSRLGDLGPRSRAALSSALGQMPRPGAEQWLLAALADEEARVRVAAARALGEVGTVGSVPALVELRDRFLGSELKTAAGDAVAAIQARIAGRDGGGAGSLALATDGGGLAVTTADASHPLEVPSEVEPAEA